MQSLLDGVVRATKTVMTRVELGGALFVTAAIGVLLASREEGSRILLFSRRGAVRGASIGPNPPIRWANRRRVYSPGCLEEASYRSSL
jgi:hypothetical protein